MDIRRKRLKELVDIAGNPAKFEKLHPSITANYVRQVISGYAPFGERAARKIEKTLNLPAGWLDSPIESEAHIREDAYEIVIKQYDASGSMGSGVVLRDQPGVIKKISVSKEWLHKNVKSFTNTQNLCIVTGFGDSMQPLYNSGDPLLVDVGIKTVEYDGVYFFRISTEGYIKRLQRIPTRNGLVIRAKSDNTPKYDSFDITEDMDFEVFGVVLKVWQSTDL